MDKQLATVFENQPKWCTDHRSPQHGSDVNCMVCEIFADWIFAIHAASEFTLVQLEILTGVPLIKLRAAESLGISRELYGPVLPQHFDL